MHQDHQQRVIVMEESKPAQPEFVKPLANLGDINEGSNVHLEAQVNPVSDHTMNIEWFKDGKAITASSRIGTLYSFGYVSLNITGVRVEDSGKNSKKSKIKNQKSKITIKKKSKKIEKKIIIKIVI
jgi:hypothetical protein